MTSQNSKVVQPLTKKQKFYICHHLRKPNVVYVNECFAFTYVCAAHACLVPKMDRIGCWMSWNKSWSSRHCKPPSGCCESVTGSLKSNHCFNHVVISPTIVLCYHLQLQVLHGEGDKIDWNIAYLSGSSSMKGEGNRPHLVYDFHIRLSIVGDLMVPLSSKFSLHIQEIRTSQI